MPKLNTVHQKRLSAGLCRDCGKRPHRPGLQMCQECADDVSRYHKLVNAAKREEREALGVKIFSDALNDGNPVAVGVVMEWLYAAVQTIKPPDKVECPFCAKEFSF